MGRKHLKDFAAEHGQTKAADLLGMAQGSLNKALRLGRAIYVIEHADGTYTAEEIRPFPSQHRPATKRIIRPIANGQ